MKPGGVIQLPQHVWVGAEKNIQTAIHANGWGSRRSARHRGMDGVTVRVGMAEEDFKMAFGFGHSVIPPSRIMKLCGFSLIITKSFQTLPKT